MKPPGSALSQCAKASDPLDQVHLRPAERARALRARYVALWLRRGAAALGTVLGRMVGRAGSYAMFRSRATLERRIVLRAD